MILSIFLSCENDDEKNVFGANNSSVSHTELGFELDEPNLILNEIAKGKLKNSINSVLLVMYGNTERKWEFEYIGNTDVISKMIFYLPHYKNCEQEVFEFSYNSINLIDKVVSTRINFCNEYKVIKVYTFNYNEDGLLKSIFMDNEYAVEENYFGYYPNGKIKEIYNDYRSSGSGVNFGVQKFYYDSLFKNVIKVDHLSGLNYHYIYEYSYDNNSNPYKDVFIAVSVFMPFIGPAYLSENNVTSMVTKNGTVDNGFEIMTEFQFNYSKNNNLLNYSFLNNERVFNVNR